jgi:hypothetical protein
MGVVRSMFPNVTVLEPTEFFFPRWHTNPLFRGSYSNWPPAFASQHLDNLRANVDRLFFAGEATSRKYFGPSHSINRFNCAKAALNQVSYTEHTLKVLILLLTSSSASRAATNAQIWNVLLRSTMFFLTRIIRSIHSGKQ